MANDNVFIYDHETGIETIREMTDAEQAIRNAEVEAVQAALAAEQAAIVQAETDRATLLAKLGITAEEARLLLS